jgi:DNA-binding response OmpR family regulator
VRSRGSLCQRCTPDQRSPNAEQPATTVLVVDDHELVGTSLVLGLRSEGLPAQRCRPGGLEQVLAAAAELPPGLVLLDLLDGDQVRVVRPVVEDDGHPVPVRRLLGEHARDPIQGLGHCYVGGTRLSHPIE